MTEQFNLIEEIKNNYIGKDEQDRKSKQKLIETLNNAVEIVSKELYTTDNHFIMELIQNAEDNNYNENVIPTLEFHIKENKIIIKNNEEGFLEENIRSICDVGKSTKKNRKREGYIGEKGIGFKSVFMISSEPQIFSNGYSFKFKEISPEEQLGFIVPYWIFEPYDFIDKNLTNIVLPIKKEFKKEISKFSDFDPLLLLFMKKLKKIEIHNENNEPIVVERRDFLNRIELIIKDESKVWKNINYSFDIPDSLKEEKRVDIKTSEIILAFPFTSENKSYDVFAFLPIRNFGFRFIINADFILTSSREDIVESKIWNKNIKNNLIKAFKKSVEIFKEDKEFMYTYYNFIPRKEDRIDLFFSSLRDEIYDFIKSNNTVLSESGKWRKPEELMFFQNFEIITNNEFEKIIGKEFVSSKIQYDKKLFESFGIKPLDVKDVFNVLRNKDFIKNKDSKWFVELYVYLSSKEIYSKSDQISEIKKIAIFKTSSGKLISLNEVSLYIYSNFIDNSNSIINELNFFDNTIINLIDEAKKEMVLNFFKKLEIEEISSSGIIKNHILKTIYKNDVYKEKTEEEQILYIRFIKDNIYEFESEFGEAGIIELKNGIKFICKNSDGGIKTLNSKECHISSFYDKNLSLDYLLEGYHDSYFVDERYYDSSSTNDTKESWINFFKKLGFCFGFLIVKEQQQNPTHISFFKKPKYFFPENSEQNFISFKENYKSEELSYSILKSEKNENKEKILNGIYYHFKNSKTNINIFKDLDYTYQPNQVYYCQRGHYMKSSVLNELSEAYIILGTDDNYHKPSDVFIKNDNIFNVFGDDVIYLKNENYDKEFYKKLGLKYELNVNMVLNFLKKLVQSQSKDLNKYTKLYKYLAICKNDAKVIIEEFKRDKLIYIPDSEFTYYSINEVLWDDAYCLIGNKRMYLEPIYFTLEGLFLGILNINKEPSVETYIEVLDELSRQGSIENSDIIIIYKIYIEISKKIKKSKNNINVSNFDNLKLLCKNGKFEEKHKIIIKDTAIYDDVLRPAHNLSILEIPDNFYPKIADLIGMWNIKKLSEEIVIKVKNMNNLEDLYYNEEITRLLNLIEKYILEYIYKFDYSYYETLKNKNRLFFCESIKCFIVDSIECDYTIKNELLKNINTVAHYSEEVNYLYIRSDLSKIEHEIAKILGKTLNNNRELVKFIYGLLKEYYTDAFLDYLKMNEIEVIPEEISISNGDNRKRLQNKAITSPSIENEEKENINKKEISKLQSEKCNLDFKESRPKISEDTIIGDNSSIDSYQGNIDKNLLKYKDNNNNMGNQYNCYKKEEPITNRSLKNISITNNEYSQLSEEERMIIGKKGEEIVYNYFISEASNKYRNAEKIIDENSFSLIDNDSLIFKIIWLNKQEETFKEHDLVLIENDIIYNVEVKSTKTKEKNWFELSENETRLLLKTNDFYKIFRVYDVYSENPIIVKFENILGMIKNRSIKGYIKLEV